MTSFTWRDLDIHATVYRGTTPPSGDDPDDADIDSIEFHGYTLPDWLQADLIDEHGEDIVREALNQ